MSSPFKLGIASAMLLLNACSVEMLGPSNASPTGTGGTSEPDSTGPGSAPRLGSAPLIAADPPPPISGGTLAVLRDGRTAVASDPDRDRIFVADLELGTKSGEIALGQHDEPGRLVEDGAGRVHVALRRGGAIVTVDPIGATVLDRRSVCALPRGITYQPATDLLHVACMGGELISLPASGGPPVRELRLPRDLRDVVVDGDVLLVSRFRRAEVLVIDGNGQTVQTITPAAYTHMQNRSGAVFVPGTAWRMRSGRDGGAMMLHQRDATDTVPTHGQSYGNGGCNSVVHPSVTTVVRGQASVATPALAGMVLAVDFALSSTGSRIAVVAAGNAHNGLPVLFSTYVDDLSNGRHASCSATGVIAAARPVEAPRNATQLQPQGEAVAVAYDGKDRIVVQTREPASLQLPETGLTISLSLTSRTDSGHLIFHANAGSGIACASCHAEGLEDGHVWNFEGLGPRRTMSLEGGITGRAPYHWTGELPDFSALADDIYVGRMSGPALGRDFVDATLRWIDTIPRLPSPSTDLTAVARGRALFEDPSRMACASCHAGPNRTTGTLANVGTGGTFKVPSLTGLAWRAPYLHNGCAATLTDRFGVCGGGDAHGVTSTLSPSQIADLIAYLESL